MRPNDFARDIVFPGMRVFPIVAVLIAPALPAFAAEPILRQTFLKDTEGWVVMGKPASLTASTPTSSPALGGELKFKYTAANQGMSVAILPLKDVPVAEMRSLRFEIKTDSPFAVGVVLSEKKPGGGNYTAMLWSNGTEWQPVVLGVGDFVPGEGPNDAVDQDGMLDFDQVEGVGLIDVSQIVSPMAGADSPVYAKSHTGEHTISIRKFEISREPVAPATGMLVDDFSRTGIGWLPLAEAKMSRSNGGLSIAYEQQPEKVVAFLHPLPKRDFSGATHIAFDVASAKPGQFILSLQKGRHNSPQEAPRYAVDFFVPAGKELQHREIALSALSLDQNAAPDPEGKLNLSDIRSITILDSSQESGSNVLTIRDLKFVKRVP